MDKKSKISIGLFVLILLISIALTFYRTMIVRDFYVVQSEVGSTEDDNVQN